MKIVGGTIHFISDITYFLFFIGTSYDSHFKNDQIFCKIKKNIYIFNYCMVKFSHVATLVELSNKNFKKMKNQK